MDVKKLTIVIFFFFGSLGLRGQQLPPDQIEKLKVEANEIIDFLAFQLNILADKNYSFSEKEIIIKEGFLRIFKDKNVQIEDDLIEGRAVISNKNVQDYLRDVMFFFNQATFEFKVSQITHHISEDGKLYFKAELTRKLSGLDRKNNPFQWNKERFIELNYNAEKRSLSIASIYTTRLSENDDLAIWFNNLPEGWKKILSAEIAVNDTLFLSEVLRIDSNAKLNDHFIFSVSTETGFRRDTVYLGSDFIFENVKKAIAITTLDLEGTAIKDLSPITKFKNLQELSLAGLEIDQLNQVAALPKLRSLNISNTPIKEIEALRFIPAISTLDFSNTKILSLEVLQELKDLRVIVAKGIAGVEFPSIDNPNLISLNLAESRLPQYRFLESLRGLEVLDLNNSGILHLQPLGNLAYLKALNISGTKVSSLAPLENSSNLGSLNISKTNIYSLKPLNNLPVLNLIYCEETKIIDEEIKAFAIQNPSVLIIYNSSNFMLWWENLSATWKNIFRERLKFKDNPTVEELHKIIGLTQLDLSSNKEIAELTAIKQLYKLKELNLRNTDIKDISPLANLALLEKVDFSKTQIDSLESLKSLSSIKWLSVDSTRISSISILVNFSNLEYFSANYTPINDFKYLKNIPNLRFVGAEQTSAEDSNLIGLALARPNADIIFRGEALQFWWEQMPDVWRGWFRQELKIDGEPTSLELHRLSMLKEMDISGNIFLSNLVPLMNMPALEVLKASNNNIVYVSPLQANTNLRYLDLSINPVQDLTSLGNLKKLEFLNLSNTPVSDIYALGKIPSLKNLNLSGSQVKSVKPLEKCKQLEILDISNSRVKRIDYLQALPMLKNLSCFNTRVNQSRADAFRNVRPEVGIIFY
ncbi:MAG: leucine-rich repeat domain-containing protein [Luteibaculaceae bacterium]